MNLTDTHAHLNDPRFEADIDETITRAEAAGVRRIINCGYDLPSSKFAVKLAEHYECVFATVGIHPHDAKNYDQSAEQALVKLSGHPKVLAIGEIGLDFHYDFSPRSDQTPAFKAQILLADQLDLPIVIHCRESNQETLQALRDAGAKHLRGVFHCFAGDERFAEEVLAMGLYIGIDGPVTYKSWGEQVRRVVDMCPLDRLLIETDCPYLTPVPFRGKRNEPAYVRYVAEEIARIKSMSLEDLAERTSANAVELFGEGLNSSV